MLTARPTAAETASSFAALDDLARPLEALLARVPELPRRALASALLLDDLNSPDPRAAGPGLIDLTLRGGRTGSHEQGGAGDDQGQGLGRHRPCWAG